MTLNREDALAKAKELGIVHPKNAKTATILKLIGDLTGETFTEEKKEKPKTEGITRCIIHSNDRDNNETEMTIGLNGEMIQVQIGEEIELPNKFLGVIKDASPTVSVSVLDEEGNPTGKTKTRNNPRYIVEAV